MVENHDDSNETGQAPQPASAPQKPEQPWPSPETALPAFTRLVSPANCPACGQATGGEPSCQICGQVLILPRGLALSTAGLRFGGYLLEGLLMVVTLGIGWLIWAFMVFPKGQTPAKQLLHMKVVYIPEARTARWWRMFFREVIAKPVIGLLAMVTFGIPYFWLLWDRNRQELWDKLATTLVVSDPQDQLHAEADQAPQ